MEVDEEAGSKEWCLSSCCLFDSRREVHLHQSLRRSSTSPQPCLSNLKGRKGDEGKHVCCVCVCVSVFERGKKKKDD